MDKQDIRERIANWFGYESPEDVEWNSGCALFGSENGYGETMWLTLDEVTDLIQSIVDDVDYWYDYE